MARLLIAALLVVRFGSLAAHTCGHSHHSSAVDDYHSHSHADHHHHHHHHHHEHDHEHEYGKALLPEELAEDEDLKLYGFGSGLHEHEHHELSTFELWAYAMGSSLLVSMASLICLTILPFIVSKGTPSAEFVNALAAFGAGAMMGDAFLHQLPHAFGRSGGHSHSHEHGHAHEHAHAHSLQELSIGISVLAGIILFFIVEKIVRYVEEHGLQTGHHHHHHSHHKYEHKKNDAVTEDTGKLEHTKDDAFTEETNKHEHKKDDAITEDTDKHEHKKDGVTEDFDTEKETKKTTTTVVESQTSKLVLGYLNLFSDGVHNFTDGMALGAAFLLHGTKGGWSRTFFLLVHELPQEVGDFGILVRSGFSVFKALAFNFLSALVALAGTAAVLLIGADPGQSSVIEGFTAGGFLYISLAGVLPDMHQQGNSLRSSLTQLVAICCGITVAIVISISE